jgi:hypothetical protein
MDFQRHRQIQEWGLEGSSSNPLEGESATLTISRKGALDPACGTGYDVTVRSPDEGIDAHLPIKVF